MVNRCSGTFVEPLPVSPASLLHLLYKHRCKENLLGTGTRKRFAPARALDESALGTIFNTYYLLLYRYVYRLVEHQTTAEDLAAEVFSCLLDQFDLGRGPQRHLRAWLYRVAHNLAFDELRQLSRRNHNGLRDDQVSSDENVAMEAQQAILHQQMKPGLQALTPKQRTVITLKYFEGLENTEVATVLELSIGAVNRCKKGD